MKLTAAQVERTLSQFKAEAIPDSHPVIPQLNNVFGEHTFFLDSIGLNIVEPIELARAGTASAGAGTQRATVVNIANWTDGNPARLEPHEPKPTDVIVTLGSQH
jgi:hypothetical protein